MEQATSCSRYWTLSTLLHHLYEQNVCKNRDFKTTHFRIKKFPEKMCLRGSHSILLDHLNDFHEQPFVITIFILGIIGAETA